MPLILLEQCAPEDNSRIVSYNIVLLESPIGSDETNIACIAEPIQLPQQSFAVFGSSICSNDVDIARIAIPDPSALAIVCFAWESIMFE